MSLMTFADFIIAYGRHGEAADPPGVRDENCPLTPGGKIAARSTGSQLIELLGMPKIVVTSGALRAR